MTNAAVQAAGPRTEKFIVPLGRYFGYVVVGAAGVLIALGIEGEGTESLGLIGFCIAFALVAWVVLIRPEVTGHRNGLLMRNMLRDTYLPWATIKSCRVAQTLQIGTRDKVYHGLGVSKSARQASRAGRQLKRRQQIAPTTGLSPLQFVSVADPESKTEVNLVMQEHVIKDNFSHTEERIETLVRQHSKATSGLAPKVAWDLLPIGALALAALAVVFAFFH